MPDASFKQRLWIVITLACGLTILALRSRFGGGLFMLDMPVRHYLTAIMGRPDLFEHFAFGLCLPVYMFAATYWALHETQRNGAQTTKVGRLRLFFQTPTFCRDALVTMFMSAYLVGGCSIAWEIDQMNGKGYRGEGPRSFQWDQCLTDFAGLICGLLVIVWMLTAAYSDRQTLGELKMAA